MVFGLRFDGEVALAAVSLTLGLISAVLLAQAAWPAMFPEATDKIWPARTQAHGCLDTRVIRVLAPPGDLISPDACVRSCGAVGAFAYRADSGDCWCARGRRCNESVPYAR